MWKDFHGSSLAGSFQSVAASVAASADGGGVADRSWVGIGQFHGAWVVEEAERPECPGQESSFSASGLPVAGFSVGGRGAERGQSSPREVRDAAAGISDASLLTAPPAAAAASSRDGYYAGEAPPELAHAAAGPADVGWPAFAAAQPRKAANCTEPQFASTQGPQSCYQVGITA